MKSALLYISISKQYLTHRTKDSDLKHSVVTTIDEKSIISSSGYFYSHALPPWSFALHMLIKITALRNK
jgi:hypothetical protein